MRTMPVGIGASRETEDSAMEMLLLRTIMASARNSTVYNMFREMRNHCKRSNSVKTIVRDD